MLYYRIFLEYGRQSYQRTEAVSGERAWPVDTCREDVITYDTAMSYVSVSKTGIARGPHEHLDLSAYFFFCGKHMFFNIKGRPHMAMVPLKVVHAYENLRNTDGLVVNMPDRLCKGKDKTKPLDVVRHEDDPASPCRVY